MHHRTDVSITKEIYDIKDKTPTIESLIILFQYIILTQDLTNNNKSLSKSIVQAIQNIGVNTHSNHQEMQNVSIYVVFFLFFFGFLFYLVQSRFVINCVI